MVVEGPHREAREALGRAIRRLDVLEFVILGAIAVLSLLGGGLIALLAVQVLDVPFRITWGVASILVFVIPAALVWRREARADDAGAAVSSDVPGTSDENG